MMARRVRRTCLPVPGAIRVTCSTGSRTSLTLTPLWESPIRTVPTHVTDRATVRGRAGRCGLRLRHDRRRKLAWTRRLVRAGVPGSRELGTSSVTVACLVLDGVRSSDFWLVASGDYWLEKHERSPGFDGACDLSMTMSHPSRLLRAAALCHLRCWRPIAREVAWIWLGNGDEMMS